ncbi:MAG: MerR family transcriptional regulator [Eubacteriales bacterium]|nr:MerR family transcriptional regulator [Eubacteriales bacterium]
MTLETAGRRYGISGEQLEVYLSSGLSGAGTLTETGVYTEADLETLGLIGTLMRAGFSREETKQYLMLGEKQKADWTSAVQIRMLRKHRSSLLENIHEKQQLLDSIDFMIRNKKKEKGSMKDREREVTE